MSATVLCFRYVLVIIYKTFKCTFHSQMIVSVVTNSVIFAQAAKLEKN